MQYNTVIDPPRQYGADLISIYFFNDTATTETYTLSLHDALPIYPNVRRIEMTELTISSEEIRRVLFRSDRKSTRLTSSHVEISYAVFCLKTPSGASESRQPLLCGFVSCALLDARPCV